MPALRLVAPILLTVAIGLPAMAAGTLYRVSCLNKADQRAAVVVNHAISLAQAIKSLRAYRKHSEVVRAKFCRSDDRNSKLVYVLTLLGSSGKVVNVTVDAENGEFLIGH